MKKIMIASLGLSLLASTAVFAQNTSGSMSGTDTTKTTKKSKKSKKKGNDTMSGSTTSTSTSK